MTRPRSADAGAAPRVDRGGGAGLGRTAAALAPLAASAQATSGRSAVIISRMRRVRNLRNSTGNCLEPVARSRVAVGTTLAGGPPHRSVRAALPHTAPTSGQWRRGDRSRFTHAPPSKQHAYPALSPARGSETCVPFGRSPSLHGLRQPRVFVRPLPRYYEIVRLPSNVHPGRAAKGLLRAIRRYGGCRWDLPVPVQGVSTHAQGLRLRGVH